jgi:hypothetical protein
MVRNQSPRAWLLARVAGLGDRDRVDRGVCAYKLAGITPQLFYCMAAILQNCYLAKIAIMALYWP